MPSKDAPAKTHHLRVTTDLSGVYTWLKDVSGVCIGLHPTSSKEKPHYHIWLESDQERTAQTIRNQMKREKLEVFGNGSYSIRTHNDFTLWYSYVFCPCKSAVEVLNNTSHARPTGFTCGKCRQTNELVYASPDRLADPAPVAVKKVSTKKLPMRLQFVKHCESLGWVKGEHLTVERFDNLRDILRQVSDTCTDFWENAFYLNEGERLVRHAIYYFGDESIKRILRERNRNHFFEKIFS